MLELRSLQSGYKGIAVLRGIDLKVSRGEFLGLWGHNGMGKSTLMRTLIGHVRANAGQILLEGRDLTSQPTYLRARAGLGFVPQGREIFSHLSVLDNLRAGAMLAAGPVEDTVSSVLEDFPRLKRLLDRPGGYLSGGEQQLLSLARCLCGRPRLMLLDEPTEGIQPSIISEMVDTLLKIRESTGLTLLLVEQNQAFIGALADRVVTMSKGLIANELSTSNFLEMQDVLASA